MPKGTCVWIKCKKFMTWGHYETTWYETSLIWAECQTSELGGFISTYTVLVLSSVTTADKMFVWKINKIGSFVMLKYNPTTWGMSLQIHLNIPNIFLRRPNRNTRCHKWRSCVKVVALPTCWCLHTNPFDKNSFIIFIVIIITTSKQSAGYARCRLPCLLWTCLPSLVLNIE